MPLSFCFAYKARPQRVQYFCFTGEGRLDCSTQFYVVVRQPPPHHSPFLPLNNSHKMAKTDSTYSTYSEKFLVNTEVHISNAYRRFSTGMQNGNRQDLPCGFPLLAHFSMQNGTTDMGFRRSKEQLRPARTLRIREKTNLARY